jgi:FixJ family two-component response regulator
MSGLELQRQLAATGYNVPIAFVTSQDDRDGRVREQILGSGAVALLPKPFSDEQLLTIVKSAVGK